MYAQNMEQHEKAVNHSFLYFIKKDDKKQSDLIQYFKKLLHMNKFLNTCYYFNQVTEIKQGCHFLVSTFHINNFSIFRQPNFKQVIHN